MPVIPSTISTLAGLVAAGIGVLAALVAVPLLAIAVLEWSELAERRMTACGGLVLGLLCAFDAVVLGLIAWWLIAG